MILHLAMSLLGTACLVAADGSDYTIGRQGNLLIVTAPADREAIPQGILSQRMTVDFQETPIDDVAELIRTVTSLNVVIAPELRVASVTVTLNAKDMALGALLNWIEQLGRCHVSYIDGALYFSDRPMHGRKVTRVYDVSDLVLSLPDFPGPELTIPAAGSQGAFLAPPMERPDQTPTTDELVELLENQLAGLKE